MIEVMTLQIQYILKGQKEYYKVYANKFDNLDEVDNLLKKKTDNLNSPISILKIEFVVQYFP